MSKLVTFGLVTTSVTVGLVFVSPMVAEADSPNPTSGVGTAEVVLHPTLGIQVIKVTLSGTWDWKRGKSCFEDRWAAGWEIDWNDPNQPGHFVKTLNGVSYDVGVAAAVTGGQNLNEVDNTVDFFSDANRCGTRPPGSDRDIGTWGPITHHYPINTSAIAPCAVMYDIRKDKDSFKVEDLVAGGAARNKENSIEQNSAAQDICLPITVNLPPRLTLAKTVDNTLGGTLAASDFTLTATRNGGGSTITGGGNSAAVTNQPVTAGTYTLSEAPVANYTPDAAWVCTGPAVVNMPAPNLVTLADASPAHSATCRITSRFNGTTDLQLTKNDGGAVVTAGQSSSFDYTITVDNAGTRDATSAATIVDVMPPWFEYQSSSATPAGTTCGVSGAAADGGQQTVTCTVPAADLQAADPPVSITVTVKVLAGAPAGIRTNRATVDTPDDPLCPNGSLPPCPPPCPVGGGNPPDNNNVACDDTEVRRDTVLVVETVDDVATNVAPGSSYNYAITVTNSGPSTVTNVRLDDTLPPGLSLVSATGVNWTCNNSVVLLCSYALGLGVGGVTTPLTVRVTLAANYTSNVVTNTAIGVATVEPGRDVSAQDSEVTNVLTPVDLRLDMSDGGAQALAGSPNTLDYTLTIDNIGLRDVTTTDTVTVTDILPPWFEFVSTNGNCNVSGSAANGGRQTVVCDVPASDLQITDPDVVITIKVRALAGAPANPGGYVSRAYVSTSDDPACPPGVVCPPPCPPSNVNNNVDCEETPLSRNATLTVTKDDAGVTVSPGDSFDYTMTVRNHGPSTVTSVVLADNLPAGLTYVSGTGSNWSCVAPGSAVSCTFALGLGADDVTSALTVRVTLAANYTLTSVASLAIGTATVEPGRTVTAQDPESTPVIQTITPSSPSIRIVTRVNGFDANTSPGLVVTAGSTLVFTYEVSNTGNTTLSNVLVTDDRGLVVTCPATTLTVGGAMVCTAVGTAPSSGQYANFGTVTGTPPASGAPVTVTDAANTFVAVPAIDITNFVNGADANTPPGLIVVTGSVVTWTYRVENTGNVDIANIDVTDDRGVVVDCGGGSSTIALLQPGEQTICSATGVALSGLSTNVGTATGTPQPPLAPGQPPVATTPVSDADSASYTGIDTAVAPPVPAPELPDQILPETGNDPGGMISFAAGLILLGGLLLGLSWLRKREPLV